MEGKDRDQMAEKDAKRKARSPWERKRNGKSETAPKSNKKKDLLKRGGLLFSQRLNT